MKLFLSGGATGALGALSFLPDSDLQTILIVVIYSGLFLGLLFGFASPYSMKGIYPKRHEYDNKVERSDSADIDSEN